MDKFQNDPTYEYRATINRPDLIVDELNMYSCTDKVLHEELVRKKDGALYHTIDKNEFWYDWKGKRYKLSWMGGDTASIQKQIDNIQKQVDALDGTKAQEAIENAKKALTAANEAKTVANDAKTTADGLSDRVDDAANKADKASADAESASNAAAAAATAANDAKAVADGLADRVDDAANKADKASADAQSASNAAADAASVANDAKAVADGLSDRFESVEDKSTEAQAIAYDAQSMVNQHKNNADIHVTADEKADWNAKQDALDSAVVEKLNTQWIGNVEHYVGALDDFLKTDAVRFRDHMSNGIMHVTDADKDVWNAKQDALDNAETLATITPDKVSSWEDAVGKAHQHANADVIDGITSEDIERWNASVSAAGVTSIDSKSGALTLKGGSAALGDVNLSVSEGGEISAAIVPDSFDTKGAAATALNDAKAYADNAVNTLRNECANTYIPASDYGVFPGDSDYVDYPGESDYTDGYARVQDVVQFVTEILEKNEIVVDGGDAKEYLYVNGVQVDSIKANPNVATSIYDFRPYEITPDENGNFEFMFACAQEIEGYEYQYAIDYGQYATVEIPSTYEIISWQVPGISGWENPPKEYGHPNIKYATRMYGSVEYSSYVRVTDYSTDSIAGPALYKIIIKKK